MDHGSAMRDSKPLDRAVPCTDFLTCRRSRLAVFGHSHFTGIRGLNAADYAGRARMAPQLKPAPKAAKTMGEGGGEGLAVCHSDAAMRREAEEVLP